MRSLLITVLLMAVAAPIAGALEFENSSVVGFVPDQVVVTLKPGVVLTPVKSDGVVRVGVPALDTLAERFDVRAMKPLFAGMTGNLERNEHVEKLERVWTVDFSLAKASLESVVDAYRQVGDLEEVRPVDICKAYEAVLWNDPGFLDGGQWQLRNGGFDGKSIRPIGAWAVALGDTNVITASIDSGVDWHHPDLGGPHPDKVNGVVWTNWTEYYGTEGVDDDDNGYVDDIRGWDFMNFSSTEGTLQNPPQDVMVPDNDPMDYGSHGTWVAGCMTAITDNGVGIAGLATGCKVMAVRVSYTNEEGLGLVPQTFAAQGLIYAINNGATILNASWGSSSILANAVNVVQAAGGLIVTAAGNDDADSPSYLGSRSGVISVAATNQNDGKASFSNFGAWVELSAPGVDIYTTGYDAASNSSIYGAVDGTSFASPVTAGAAALIWSNYPGLTYREVADTLQTYADNIDDLNPGYEGLLGAGRVNLKNFFKRDGFQRVPDDYIDPFDALQESNTGDTIALRGGDLFDDGMRIHNRDLQVLGGYDAAFATRDPVGNPTILRADITKPALDFQGGATAATVVDGFSCEDGGGKVVGSIPQTGRYGGCVFLLNTSPTLRNLDISGGSVGYSAELGGGGGMVLIGSEALVENVMIHDNTAIYGAGLYVFEGAPTLRDIVIENNLVITDNFTYPPKGGAIYAIGSDLTLENVTIENHPDVDEGGAIYVGAEDLLGHLTYLGGRIAGHAAKDNGGGLFMNGGGDLVMSDVTLQGNTKTAQSTFMSGGGIYLDGGTAVLDGIVVTDCEANLGGGIFLNGLSDVAVTNSVFARNVGSFFGGGVAVQNTTTGDLTNNTAAYNDGTANGGGGFYVTGSTLTLDNNISAFNTGGAGLANGVYFSGTATTACNDVYGNASSDWGGIADPTGNDGNIAEDPQFCDAEGSDFRVTDASPCAPAHSGACGLIGALSAGCEENPVEDQPQIPTVFAVEQNFPNPFNPQTTIRFSLPQAGFTTVTIFDLAGRRIRTLLAEDLAAAVHQVRWNGRDEGERSVSAGVYFYRVLSGDRSHVGRMALVK